MNKPINQTEWFQAADNEIAAYVHSRISVAVLLINGTRRWFLSQYRDWSQYPRASGDAHRRVCQLFYDHGISTLVQPFFGFDLLDRGGEYVEMALRQALAVLSGQYYLDWYEQNRIRVSFYGRWRDTLCSLGYQEVTDTLQMVAHATQQNSERRLLVGLFADRPLDDIVTLARFCDHGQELIELYYGLPLPAIDLIVGSGQPAIWDIPLLSINQASLYFVKVPTFFLTRETLRNILYDHLFERVADDNIMAIPPNYQVWQLDEVLGIGKRTPLGWTAV
jgi:hypothetical protein